MKTTKQMMSQASKRILIVCSPSAGILDSWLPVVKSIHEQHPELSFSIIFPRNRTVSEIDLDSTLLKFFEKIIDSVIFRGHKSTNWYQCESLEQAKEQVASSKLERIICKRSKNNRYRNFILRYARKLFRAFDVYRYRGHKIDLNSTLASFSCILYDVYVHRKSYNKEIISGSRDKLKFSISHGLNLLGSGTKLQKLKSPDEHQKTIVFSFSENERDVYNEKYRIPEDNIVVTGIHRHDPEWIDFYIHLDEEREKASTLFKDDFIFIISRPDSTDYHPTERMKRSIQIIKDLAFDKLNVKIVVKLHPKEKKRGLYEEILGEDEYGESWIYSNAHPFTIGSKCLFAVSYLSGVPVDLINMGVPTIEMLDLRGIEKYEKLQDRKDKNGAPMMYFRYNKLVLGASTKEEFFDQADRILADKNSVNSKLRKAYEKIYKNPEGSIQRTVNRIVQEISNE